MSDQFGNDKDLVWAVRDVVDAKAVEIANLESDLAACSKSHQKQNALVAKAEDVLDAALGDWEGDIHEAITVLVNQRGELKLELLETKKALFAMQKERDGLKILTDRYNWRPISEAHEDYGDLVLMNINEPGSLVLSHVCNLNWDLVSEGMTHFARVPMLGQEQYEELKAKHAAAKREGQ